MPHPHPRCLGGGLLGTYSKAMVVLAVVCAVLRGPCAAGRLPAQLLRIHRVLHLFQWGWGLGQQLP